MSGGSNRINDRIKELDPTDFIKFIREIDENTTNSEVFIRRVISSLYLALYNYWSCIMYEEKRERGSGPRQDYFPYTRFLKEMSNMK